MRPIVFMVMLVVALHAPVYAQNEPICPADVLLALARSGSACYGLARNEACIGNGSVESSFYEGYARDFAKPGDRIAIGGLQTVGVAPVEEGLSTAVLFMQANLTEAEERSVVLFLLGDASVENRVPPLVELTAYATGTLNIRRTPEIDGEIVERQSIGEAVVVNGRTQESDWLRVKVPNSNDLGWVGTDVVELTGDVSRLAVVTVESPVYRPFEIFSLRTGSAALCSGALDGGLLLQTPNTSESVTLTVNGVEARLAGTFFLQSGGALVVHVLDGGAELSSSGAEIFVPAGSRSEVALDGDGIASSQPTQPAPYDFSRIRALPTNNLPYRVQVAAALTPEEIAQKQAEHAAAVVEATVEPVVSVDTACRRTARRDTTLWAGPGVFYEAINEIEAGTPVQPVLQTIDPDGAIWWQLRNSNWIQADQAAQAGFCEDVPVTTVVQPPPTNTLSLETCKTTNGPLRAGQYVRIEFIPQAFDNYGEARDALLIDPGRITIGSRVYWPDASEPIRLGTVGERYLRQFYIYWVAEPGTFRIVGERLHYTPICTITVPVG